MAIWQFTVGLVPRAWVEMEGNVLAMLYDADGYYDTSIAWRQNQPKVDLDVLMSQVLPAIESKIVEMKFWGDETKSDIHVCFDRNTVESVQVRIDTRVDSIELCFKIVELARALDCYLFFPEARSISIPYQGSICNAVQQSTAARFAAAPRAFLSDLACRAS
jgi:hypothetical protein